MVLYISSGPGFKNVFTDDQEAGLFNYILDIEVRLMGLTFNSSYLNASSTFSL